MLLRLFPSSRFVAVARTTNNIIRNPFSTLAPPTSPTNPKNYFLLFYEYDAKDMEELVAKRNPMRVKHLAHAKEYAKQKKLIMGGAHTDSAFGPMGGTLLFASSSGGSSTRKDVEEFARNDPYVIGKLVKSYTIREWTVVIDPTSELK
jgi:uncharacterized protein YciI